MLTSDVRSQEVDHLYACDQDLLLYGHLDEGRRVRVDGCKRVSLDGSTLVWVGYEIQPSDSEGMVAG